MLPIHIPLSGLTPMTPFYSPALLRQGVEAVFGKPEEQATCAARAAQRQFAFDRELRLSREGAGTVVFGPNPQINPMIVDRFIHEYSGTQLGGVDAMLRGVARPSAVDAANEAAKAQQKQAEEANPLCGLYRFVNQNKGLAVIGLVGLYLLTQAATPKAVRRIRAYRARRGKVA